MKLFKYPRINVFLFKSRYFNPIKKTLLRLSFCSTSLKLNLNLKIKELAENELSEDELNKVLIKKYDEIAVLHEYENECEMKKVNYLNKIPFKEVCDKYIAFIGQVESDTYTDIYLETLYDWTKKNDPFYSYTPPYIKDNPYPKKIKNNKKNKAIRKKIREKRLKEKRFYVWNRIKEIINSNSHIKKYKHNASYNFNWNDMYQKYYNYLSRFNKKEKKQVLDAAWRRMFLDLKLFKNRKKAKKIILLTLLEDLGISYIEYDYLLKNPDKQYKYLTADEINWFVKGLLQVYSINIAYLEKNYTKSEHAYHIKYKTRLSISLYAFHLKEHIKLFQQKVQVYTLNCLKRQIHFQRNYTLICLGFPRSPYFIYLSLNQRYFRIFNLLPRIEQEKLISKCLSKRYTFLNMEDFKELEREARSEVLDDMGIDLELYNELCSDPFIGSDKSINWSRKNLKKVNRLNIYDIQWLIFKIKSWTINDYEREEYHQKRWIPHLHVLSQIKREIKRRLDKIIK